MAYDGTPVDDDDDQDDDNENSKDYQDEDSEEDSQDDDSSNSYDNPAAAVENAAPHEQEAHRSMLGEALQHLTDHGIDVDEIAEDAGISGSDVDALSHDDVATLTQYLAQNHPDVVQKVADRFPAAQGILGALTGGDGSSGGFLGHIFGH